MKFEEAGIGKWDNEPDFDEFESNGLRCVLNRGPLGAWCGYVRIGCNHPLFGVKYNENSAALVELEETNPSAEMVFEVHGGITYSDKYAPGDTSRDKSWWFGFDCSHAGDLAPKHHHLYFYGYEVYRDIGYIRSETEKLAKQLASISAGEVTGL